MFTPRVSKMTTTTTAAAPSEVPVDISPLTAAELGLEYASLRAAGNCPTGMYITPSQETLLKWYGVFFVHKGPYAGSVLRFTISFPAAYPRSAPIIRFDSDVFHPMVDSKTKIWTPRGRLTQWRDRPRIDHVPHLLHSLKSSFKSAALESITEDEAVNKQVWSLYHHSHQTFRSMTSQRALHSTSLHHLYPTAHPILSPTSPTKGDKLSIPPLSPTRSSPSKNPPKLSIPPSPTRGGSRSQQGQTPGRPFPSSSNAPASPLSPTKGGAYDGHRRSTSMMSAVSSIEEGPITFKEISEREKDKLWEGLKQSLGSDP